LRDPTALPVGATIEVDFHATLPSLASSSHPRALTARPRLLQVAEPTMLRVEVRAGPSSGGAEQPAAGYHLLRVETPSKQIRQHPSR